MCLRRIIEKAGPLGLQFYNVVHETEIGAFLKGRVNRANEKASALGLPKIYVSVHANAGPLSEDGGFVEGINGIECYYYPSSSQGRYLARIFQRHLILQTGWRDRGLKNGQILCVGQYPNASSSH